MKLLKRVVCILLVAIIMMSANVIGASAANSKPITISVKTSTNSTSTLGIINVTITVKNVSNKTIKNVVCSSSNSKNVAFYKPIINNVTVCNPKSKLVNKRDAMISKLLPGGKMVYTYCLVTSYQNAKTKVSKTTANLMLNQHKQLNAKNFRDIKDISKTKVSSTSNLKFGSINSVLKVTAYYGVGDAEYKAIASASDISDYSIKAPVTNGGSSNSSSVSRPTSNISSSTGNTEAVGSTTGKKNALKTAENYLSFSAFSKKGLIDQLEFEGYTSEEAKYAVDNCGADWNEQAAKKAQSYLNFTSFSKQGLIEQLEFEGFTHDQAVYGAKAVGF